MRLAAAASSALVAALVLVAASGRSQVAPEVSSLATTDGGPPLCKAVAPPPPGHSWAYVYLAGVGSRPISLVTSRVFGVDVLVPPPELASGTAFEGTPSLATSIVTGDGRNCLAIALHSSFADNVLVTVRARFLEERSQFLRGWRSCLEPTPCRLSALLQLDFVAGLDTEGRPLSLGEMSTAARASFEGLLASQVQAESRDPATADVALREIAAATNVRESYLASVLAKKTPSCSGPNCQGKFDAVTWVKGSKRNDLLREQEREQLVAKLPKDKPLARKLLLDGSTEIALPRPQADSHEWRAAAERIAGGRQVDANCRADCRAKLDAIETIRRSVEVSPAAP